MGGNLVKKYGLEPKRICRSEYNDLLFKIKTTFPNGLEIPFIHSKEDFGDIDYLIDADYYHEDLIKGLIKSFFNSSFIHKNSEVYSFDHNGFQIDLICKPKNKLFIAQTYLSYNDVGNLMGRIYHKFGLSYGSDGLYYPIRQSTLNVKDNDSDHIINNVCLCDKPLPIFSFGDFSYIKFLKGFDTLEEIFEYVISSKYFNADIFKLENLNHMNRTRNRKRPTFMKFLEYLEDKNITKKYQYKENKLDYIDFIDKKFPIKDKINQCKQDYLKRQIIKNKINGHKIIQWIKYTGKDIPTIINKFKDYLSSLKINYDLFLENHSERVVKVIFNKWWKEKQGGKL